MEKVSIDATRYQKKSHKDKGRPPLNHREEILAKVAALTKTAIPRWCRYDISVLEKALIQFNETNNPIRNKAAYFVFLVKLYDTV